MFQNMYEYIKDLEFRFTVYSDRIHVINYKKILILEDKRISFTSDDKRIVIKGKNLVLNKLLEQEILILGNILSIEVFND